MTNQLFVSAALFGREQGAEATNDGLQPTFLALWEHPPAVNHSE
jgi:hypothetical protein